MWVIGLQDMGVLWTCTPPRLCMWRRDSSDGVLLELISAEHPELVSQGYGCQSDIRTLVCQQYREPIAAAMATTTTAHPAPAMSSTDSDRIDKEPRLTHTSTNISLSPELFEKLYLAPKTPNANDHVGRYANATPLGFLG